MQHTSPMKHTSAMHHGAPFRRLLQRLENRIIAALQPSLVSYGPCSYGLENRIVAALQPSLVSYGLYSYGVYSYGVYSYGLYSYGLWTQLRRAEDASPVEPRRGRRCRAARLLRALLPRGLWPSLPCAL